MQLQLEFAPWRTMTIKEKILYVLRRQEWVNTNEWMDLGREFYTARNRISEINREGEHFIDSRQVEWGKIHEYRLVR